MTRLRHAENYINLQINRSWLCGRLVVRLVSNWLSRPQESRWSCAPGSGCSCDAVSRSRLSRLMINNVCLLWGGAGLSGGALQRTTAAQHSNQPPAAHKYCRNQSFFLRKRDNKVFLARLYFYHIFLYQFFFINAKSIDKVEIHQLIYMALIFQCVYPVPAVLAECGGGVRPRTALASRL